jgi:hypothetical protein
MNPHEQRKRMSQIIAKCWADEGYKRKLLADPAATLRSEGIELPVGQSVKVLENSDKVLHLVIPEHNSELSEKDLEQVAAGYAARYDDDCVPQRPSKA